MNNQKLNKVVGLGILAAAVGLSNQAVYANTTNVKEIVSENFVATNTYRNDLFSDVKENQWFVKGLSSSVNLSLMQGESSDRFNPSGNITVAQTIAVASRIHALYYTGSLEVLSSYSGVKWYSGAEQYALEKGIVKEGDFSVEDMNRPATRAELCYILDGTLPGNEITDIVNNNLKMADIKDLNSSVKYVDTVLKHVNAGIITGYEDGTVKPNNKITRAEACVIIDRLVRPSERINQDKTETNTSGSRVVYVTQRNKYGTQSVYATAAPGLTPIKVKYGRHVYLSNNQQEYDYVIKVVEDTLNFKGKTGEIYKEELKKWDDSSYRTRMMKKFTNQFKGISEKDAYELYKIESACYSARRNTGSTTKNGVDSAYELLSKGYGDCTADAMVNLAVMDAMGYNAKTVVNDSQKHEWVMIEVNGTWLHNYGAGMERLDVHIYNRVTTPDTFNHAK